MSIAIDEQLATLRACFDDVDDAIIKLLATRQRLSDQAGVLKKVVGRPVRDDVREAHAAAQRRITAKTAGADPDVVAALFDVLVRASRERQERL
jgi:prephenate dehydrogenase